METSVLAPSASCTTRTSPRCTLLVRRWCRPLAPNCGVLAFTSRPRSTCGTRAPCAGSNGTADTPVRPVSVLVPTPKPIVVREFLNSSFCWCESSWNTALLGARMQHTRYHTAPALRIDSTLVHAALCAVHTEACVGIVAINRPQLARR